MTVPHSRPYPRRRRASTGRRFAAVAALLIAVLAGASFLLVRARDDSAQQARAAVDAFAAAWSRGDDARAGALTDARGAAKALETNRAGLDGAKVTVRTGSLTMKDDSATGRLRIRWSVPAFGSLRLHRAGHGDQGRRIAGSSTTARGRSTLG